VLLNGLLPRSIELYVKTFNETWLAIGDNRELRSQEELSDRPDRSFNVLLEFLVVTLLSYKTTDFNGAARGFPGTTIL
jgi:hypothetical protein